MSPFPGKENSNRSPLFSLLLEIGEKVLLLAGVSFFAALIATTVIRAIERNG